MQIKWRPVVSLFEKALWTYVQSFITALLGTTFFEDLNFSTLEALAIATIPTAITVLVNAVEETDVDIKLPRAIQALFRVLRSGAASFGGFLLAIPAFSLDAAVGKAALGAAGVAILAAIKAELARFVGNPDSPATLPVTVDIPEDDGSYVDENFDPNDPELIGDPLEPGEVPPFENDDEVRDFIQE